MAVVGDAHGNIYSQVIVCMSVGITKSDLPMLQLIYPPRSVVTESVFATVCMNNHNSV